MSGLDEELERRLAAARVELEEVERAREERSADAAKLAKVEAVERELSDTKAIAAAEADLGVGKFAIVRTELGAVIVRRPNHMHYRRFINLKDPGSDDAMRLVLTCLVHPARAAFEVLADELPGVPILAAGAVVDLASGRRVEVEGKS